MPELLYGADTPAQGDRNCPVGLGLHTANPSLNCRNQIVDMRRRMEETECTNRLLEGVCYISSLKSHVPTKMISFDIVVVKRG